MVSLHLSDSTINSLSNNELNILKYVYEHGDPTLPLRSYVFAGNWDIPDLQNLSISCAIKL